MTTITGIGATGEGNAVNSLRQSARGPFDPLEVAASEWPTKICISDGQNALSYEETLLQTKRIGAVLRELGVQPGQVVALELPIALHLLFTEACFAIAAVSCRLPSSNVDPSFNVDWCFSSFNRHELRAKQTVFVDAAFLKGVSSHAPDLKAATYPSDQSICRVIFSSGTTGSPKPIAFSVSMAHGRALIAHQIAVQNSAYMSLLDVGTAVGFHTFHASVMFGDTYLVPDSAQHNLRQIQQHQVSSIVASPIQIANLMREIALTGARVPRLARVYSAGTILPLAVRRMIENLTNADVYNLYGSTEAGRAAEGRVNSNVDVRKAGSIAAGTTLQIVDERNSEVPKGVTGSIRYRREHQATGYLGDPTATREAFRDGWFYTGDIGLLDDDDNLLLVGRTKDLINAGGVKVDPNRLESFAVGLRGVIDAAVFGYDKPGGITGIAIAIVKDSQFPSNALLSALRREFGAACPDKLVVVSEIPRNQMGKPMRESLRDLAT